MTADSHVPTANAPIFAVLTPHGRGAIASISLRGHSVLPIVARRFQPTSGKPLTSLQSGRAVFGRFQTSAVAEDLVVGLIADDEIEIHCHGGVASVETICSALVADGCRRLAPDEWILLQQGDVIAAQALLALAQAPTERTAAILLDQYRGALRSELNQIRQWLSTGDVPAAGATVAELLSRSSLGLHLTQPWKVVLAGPPNAGKSSLMNALLGYQRSIVWREPGTTRDVLTATTAFDGWPVELIDTAGLRATSDALEAEGVARAQQQITSADLVLNVIEITALRSQVEQDRKTLVVFNKCDLPHAHAIDRQPGLETSALTGQGLDTLCRTIAHRLVPKPPAPRSAVPFTDGHISALTAAQDALSRQDPAAAAAHLTSLLG